MGSYGINWASLLGVFDLPLSLAIFGLTWKAIADKNRIQDNTVAFDIIQIVLVPLSLLICGTIVILQGWRLDPVLFFAMLLLHLIIIFMLTKDFLLYRRAASRHNE